MVLLAIMQHCSLKHGPVVLDFQYPRRFMGIKFYSVCTLMRRLMMFYRVDLIQVNSTQRISLLSTAFFLILLSVTQRERKRERERENVLCISTPKHTDRLLVENNFFWILHLFLWKLRGKAVKMKKRQTTDLFSPGHHQWSVLLIIWQK